MKEPNAISIDPEVLTHLAKVSTTTIEMQLYNRGYRRCSLMELNVAPWDR